MTTTNARSNFALRHKIIQEHPMIPAWRKPGFLLVPAIGFLLLFYLLPILHVVGLSFDFPLFKLAHYGKFFTGKIYIQVLIKTLWLSASVTLICLLLGYPVALALAKSRSTIRNLILLLVIIPYLTSFLVRSYALIIVLSDRGLINGLLSEMGILDQPIQLVYNTFGVYVGMVHIMLPFMILPLYGVMTNIDHRLVNAAQSLGAGPVLSFLRVYLPLSFPGITSGCLIVFVLSLGFFITPALLGGLGDIMLVNLISVQVSRLGNWEFASAASVVLLAATILVFLIFQLLSGSSVADSFLSTGGKRQTRPRRGLIQYVIRLLPASLFMWMRRQVFATAHRYRINQRRRYLSQQRPTLRYGRWILASVICLVLLFLIIPSLVVIPMSFSSAEFITFPPPGWSLKWYYAYFDRPDWVIATVNSFQVAILTTLVSTTLGTLGAYGLVRGTFKFKQAMIFFIVSPIIVPPIVQGLGLYGVFVKVGLFGTIWGLVLAHSIGATALVIITVSATLARYDFTFERASMSLGAGPITTFRRITLPIIRPGVIAGAVFAFIYSFDELVVTMTIAGIRLETLPLKMWRNIKNEIDPVIAVVSVMLIALPIIWVVVLTLSRRAADRQTTVAK
jgi:putative spermidine/putrescine transport system permease protein